MPVGKATIRFLVTYTVKDEDSTYYEEGQSYTMVKSSAEHFIRRGLAEEVETPKPSAPKKAEKKTATSEDKSDK